MLSSLRDEDGRMPHQILEGHAIPGQAQTARDGVRRIDTGVQERHGVADEVLNLRHRRCRPRVRASFSAGNRVYAARDDRARHHCGIRHKEGGRGNTITDEGGGVHVGLHFLNVVAVADEDGRGALHIR